MHPAICFCHISVMSAPDYLLGPLNIHTASITSSTRGNEAIPIVHAYEILSKDNADVLTDRVRHVLTVQHVAAGVIFCVQVELGFYQLLYLFSYAAQAYIVQAFAADRAVSRGGFEFGVRAVLC